jgi:hypothetical protein
LDDKFLDEMVRVSKLYAVRKGRMEVEPKLTHNTMRASIAVVYMTGFSAPVTGVCAGSKEKIP